MLRPASETRAMTAEAAKVQAEKNTASAERFIHETVAAAIDTAAALGHTYVWLEPSRLPPPDVCDIVVAMVRGAGYMAQYERPVTMNVGLTSVSLVPFQDASFVIRWEK